ncbi:MAG TPA: fumarylacetoacetate hydrolase, partial [Casimicrobiaceae bacterium]|nr:fumarylacetoacetate hydrolase [Casimicrobiaceae bacterium]
MGASLRDKLTPGTCLPVDSDDAVVVGRVFLPSVGGPTLVRVHGDDLIDLSTIAPTSSELLDRPDIVERVRATRSPSIGSLARALANSARDQRELADPWLLAPCDLQAIKAAGVTFVESMLERVI